MNKEELKRKRKENPKWRILFRYKYEILQKRKDGYSLRELQRWLGKAHKKKVSYETIREFLKCVEV